VRKCYQWKLMSVTRKRYFVRLVGRCMTFLAGIVMLLTAPEEFEILEGGNFFKRFSVLHILWGVWVFDMIEQLVPVKKHVPLGSQKLFAMRFKPLLEKINAQALKQYIVNTTRSAFWVMLLWCMLIAAIGWLHAIKILNHAALLLISVAFYVCDLICVLIWCPFRLIMKNKCCTTCRIFNWDHMMMFSPLIFVGGFYSVSLVAMAAAALIVWEACVALYPERFWEQTNGALKCANCTDKLCTQYCRKLA